MAAIQIQGLNSPRPRAGYLDADVVDAGMQGPDSPSGMKGSLPEPLGALPEGSLT